MTFLKETEDETKKWKDISCYWIRRINIVKMSILSKQVKSMQFLSKYQWYFFTEIEQKLP